METPPNPSPRATSHDPSSPLVVAVVLNWQAPRETKLCLQALEAIEYDRLKVVLIDNGCTDFDGEALPASVTYLRAETNLGYAGGANLGTRHALDLGADFVWFVNNDAQPEPDSLRRMVETTRANPAIAAIGPKILRQTKPDTIDSMALSFDRRTGRFYLVGHDEVDRGQYDSLATVDAITGCAPLVRSDFLRTTGGFDQRYYLYLEDLDLCLRLAAQGGLVVCAPTARVLHNRAAAKSGRQSDASLYYTSRNHLLVLATHDTGGAVARRLRRAVAAALNLAFALRGEPRRMPARLRAVLAGILDYRRGNYGPKPGR